MRWWSLGEEEVGGGTSTAAGDVNADTRGDCESNKRAARKVRNLGDMLF